MSIIRYLVAWIRALLSLAVLAAKVEGLRRDLDALVAAQQAQAQLSGRVVEALNNTSIGAAEVHERLDWHEKHSAVLADSADKLRKDRKARARRAREAQEAEARAAESQPQPPLELVRDEKTA